MSTSTLRLYRSTLRDIRLRDTVHKYREHRKTSTVLSSLRNLFEETVANTAKSLGSQPESRQLVELSAYLRANRLHQLLLERYNAGINMTQEERSRLTARRVGLNMPKEYSPDGSPQ